MVINIHLSDVLPKPASPIPNTYNPPKYDRAYYFTEHGCQLKKKRRFNVDKGERNYDDVPGELCIKVFPQVSKKGTSYLFLWFCPFHGHCYGFHLIPGSESRKGVAASLYTHLKKPQRNYSMTLLAACPNITTTENQASFKIQGIFTMSSTDLHINALKHFAPIGYLD